MHEWKPYYISLSLHITNKRNAPEDDIFGLIWQPYLPKNKAILSIVCLPLPPCTCLGLFSNRYSCFNINGGRCLRWPSEWGLHALLNSSSEFSWIPNEIRTIAGLRSLVFDTLPLSSSISSILHAVTSWSQLFQGKKGFHSCAHKPTVQVYRDLATQMHHTGGVFGTTFCSISLCWQGMALASSLHAALSRGWFVVSH